MADPLQVINTLLNIGEYIRKGHEDKLKERGMAQNQAQFEQYMKNGGAGYQSGFEDAAGDPAGAAAPVAAAAAPEPLKYMAENPAVPSALSGLIMGGQRQPSSMMPGEPTAEGYQPRGALTLGEIPSQLDRGTPVAGASSAPAPEHGRYTGAPALSSLDAGDWGGGATPIKPMKVQPQSASFGMVPLAPEETPAADGALPPERYLDPSDPSNATQVSGAIARGYPLKKGFPYVNPIQATVTVGQDGLPSFNYHPTTMSERKSMGADWMGQWISHGGGFAEGIRRGQAAGLSFDDKDVERMGSDTFERNAADLREEWLQTNPGSEYGDTIGPSIIAAARLNGGYVPQKWMGVFTAPVDVAKAGATRQAQIMAEAMLRGKIKKIARVTAQGRAEGENIGEHRTRKKKAETAATVTAATTRAKALNEPIGESIAKAYGYPLTPFMTQNEASKYLSTHRSAIMKSEKDNEFLQGVRTTRAQLSRIASLAREIAADPGASGVERWTHNWKLMAEQAKGSPLGVKIETFNRLVTAFQSGAARDFNRERGVMTDKDYDRAEFFGRYGTGSIAGFSDTVALINQMESELGGILDARTEAFYNTRAVDQPGVLSLSSEAAEAALRNKYGDQTGSPAQRRTSMGLATEGAVSPPTADQAQQPSNTADFHPEEVPGIVNMLTPAERHMFETDPASLPDDAWNQAVLNYRGATQNRDGAEQ